MKTPEKSQTCNEHLFKMFSLRGENSPSTPIATLTQNKPLFKKPVQDSVKTAESLRVTARTRVASEENQEVEEELADFKKYLHKSSIMERELQTRKAVRQPCGKDSAERQAMKDRLELKIQQAQDKLAEIKSTLKKYQLEKQQIVKNSDMRRSSIHTHPPTARRPPTPPRLAN